MVLKSFMAFSKIGAAPPTSTMTLVGRFINGIKVYIVLLTWNLKPKGFIKTAANS